jgi:hypothetical protein
MDESIFSTRDLYLASALVSLKFQLIGIDFQFEGTKNLPIGYFKFENSANLERTRLLYAQGMVMVEPKMYITNMRSLKAEVSNATSNPNRSIGATGY